MWFWYGANMKTHYLDFSGQTALVTGASSGIGAATAQLFAELGARVAIGYHRNQRGAEQVCETAIQVGSEAIAIQADVRRADEISKLVQATTARFGSIDILVNNAGSLIGRIPLQEMTEAHWGDVLDLNLKSAWLCSQTVGASMIERKAGVIINNVSIAGRNGGGFGSGAYAAAKAGLIALTKAQAKEFAPHGVRVNAVSPGVIDTPFHETFSTPEMIQVIVKTIPLGRVGTSSEIAKVIAFLASDLASYVVGETIEINGGQLML